MSSQLAAMLPTAVRVFLLVALIFAFSGLDVLCRSSLENVFIIKDRETLKAVFADEASRDFVNVVYFTKDVESDAYLKLYLGQWASNFEYMTRMQRVIIFDHGDVMNLEFYMDILPLLPKFTIFCIIEAGPFGIKVAQFDFFVSLLSLHNIVVMHNNHEQPWVIDDKLHIDYTFGSIDALNTAYSRLAMVIRNYFYSPISSSSYYLPVFAPMYGTIIGGEKDSSIDKPGQKLSSKRPLFCDFVGRRIYVIQDFPDIDEVRENNHIYEREKLFQLLENPETTNINCSAHYKGKQQISELDHINYLSYDDYIYRLGETVFSLCPAGNNPETFRIFEALEMGSIPILVRPKEESKNFVSSGLWSTYSGPVLDNWSDLGAFFSHFSSGLNANEIASKLDALQFNVSKWYDDFKTFEKVKVAKRLDEVFDEIEIDFDLNHKSINTEVHDNHFDKKIDWDKRHIKYRILENGEVVDEVHILRRELSFVNEKREALTGILDISTIDQMASEIQGRINDLERKSKMHRLDGNG